jgi:hypothetical protein
VSFLEACSGGALIAVIASSGGGSARRPIDLTGVQAGLRERALALSIAELLRARWAEITAKNVRPGASTSTTRVTPDNPQVTPSSRAVDPTMDAVRRRPDHDPRSPWLLSTGIEWRFLFQRDAALTGARLGLSIPVPLSWLLRLSADGSFFYDGSDDGEREAGLWLFTGSLGASAGYSWGNAEIDLGPRMELGWGAGSSRMKMDDTGALHASGLVAIASVTASGRVRLTPRLWISLDLELGHALLGFEAQSPQSPEARPSFGIGGAILGGRLAVALAL